MLLKDKKANHGKLIIMIVSMFLSVFIFAVILEYGLDLMGIGMKLEENVNHKFAQDFEIVSVYVFGTNDGQVNGGTDNFTITVRLDKDSIEIPFTDLMIQFQTQGITKRFDYEVGTNLTETTYTYHYNLRGDNFKDEYLSTGDVAEMKFQLPSGYTIPEDQYIIINIIYKRKNTNIPVKFTLPAGLINEKTYLYP